MIRHGGNLSFTESLAEAERSHMGKGKVHETLRTLVADLDREGIEYAIVGAMALNAHGYRRETLDIDVLVTPLGLERFKKFCVGRGYAPKFAAARNSFLNTETKVPVKFLTTGEYPGDGKPKSVAFPDPLSAAIAVEGIRVVSLPILVNLKLASGMIAPHRLRELADDQDVIRLMHLPSSLANGLGGSVRSKFLELYEQVSQDNSQAE